MLALAGTSVSVTAVLAVRTTFPGKKVEPVATSKFTFPADRLRAHRTVEF
jgi:hypothetical protein